MTCTVHIVQKCTTFLGFTGALPNALTTPVSAPARTLASFRVLSSPRSSRSISAFFRRIVWKSSSSAPASRPVPNNVATALPSADPAFIPLSRNQSRPKSIRRNDQGEIVRTCFAQRAVPGEVRRLPAQFARASIRVHALAAVLWTRARKVPATRTHEASREGQRIVWVCRLATPREVMVSRAAPVADADDDLDGGTTPRFRFVVVVVVVAAIRRALGYL
jgi:hypothetical protein